MKSKIIKNTSDQLWSDPKTIAPIIVSKNWIYSNLSDMCNQHGNPIVIKISDTVSDYCWEFKYNDINFVLKSTIANDQVNKSNNLFRYYSPNSLACKYIGEFLKELYKFYHDDCYGFFSTVSKSTTSKDDIIIKLDIKENFIYSIDEITKVFGKPIRDHDDTTFDWEFNYISSGNIIIFRNSLETVETVYGKKYLWKIYIVGNDFNSDIYAKVTLSQRFKKFIDSSIKDFEEIKEDEKPIEKTSLWQKIKSWFK